MAVTRNIKGKDVEETIAYQPAVRPGYSAWANLFPGKDRNMLLSFLEIRKEKNPHFQAPSLEFAESLSFAIKVLPDLLAKSTPDYVFECPVLSSEDGRDWREVGRSTVFDRHFWFCTLPDGGLLRAHADNSCRYDLGQDRFRAFVSRSDDSGTTWREVSTILEDAYLYVHRLKVLRDSTLIAAGCLRPKFGPGTGRVQRTTIPVGAEEIATGVFFLSRDGGLAWGPPQVIVPGEYCWEPDFVELPSGDLLFICSTSQASRNTRQYYHKRQNTLIPGPVLEIDADPHFIVPETVAVTGDGLIVGARRWQGVPGSGTYVCSNDEGATWHVIDGLPRCNYQPMIQRQKDGRFICASHVGSDSRFGQHDMNVTVHIFGIEGTLPHRTQLSLAREMNTEKTKYVNAYLATLTAGGSPLPGKTVEFRVLDLVSGEDHRDMRHAQDVSTRGKSIKSVTDNKGRARLDLSDYDQVIDIHVYYMVGAFFKPDGGEGFAPCRAPVYGAYAMTGERGKPNSYEIYLTENVLWIADELADGYPEIESFMEQLSGKGAEPFGKQDIVDALGVSEERVQEVIHVLLAHKVLFDQGNCVYVWNPLRLWVTPDHPLPLKEVKRICVSDFLV